MAKVFPDLNYDVKLISFMHSLRRMIRVLKRVLDKLDDDDIQRKFSLFLDEHETLMNQLKLYTDYDFSSSDTPEAIIQFPISSRELLSIGAKSSKQVLEELTVIVKEDELPSELSKLLKEALNSIANSYDYIQALADIWD